MHVFENATNMKVFGIENSEESVKIAKDSGLDVCQGFVDNEDYKISEYPFDVFYIMNFLEHIPNPKEFLRGIYNNLSDDAVGLVEVPNFDMIKQNGLYSEFISDHLMYFTKDTLKLLLENCGFVVESCEVIWNDYIISSIVRKKNKDDFEIFKSNYQRITSDVYNYLENRSKIGDISIWGAGHQSLADIALLNMKEYIKYVIDSASFKQNKYTPSSHLKIVSPEILKTDTDVKTIIIIAGGYSSEIKKIIREKYNSTEREIAILDEDGIKVL